MADLRTFNISFEIRFLEKERMLMHSQLFFPLIFCRTILALFRLVFIDFALAYAMFLLFSLIYIYHDVFICVMSFISSSWENSPNLCPTIFSLTVTGMCFPL